MTSEIAETFNILLFGEGFWLGFLVIISICLVVSIKVKFSGAIFAICLVFLAFEYIANLEGSSNKMWGVILCFFGAIFLVWQVVSDIQSQ